MKEFAFFVAKNLVKKQPPDANLARAIARESAERLTMARSIAASQKPKYALENAYEAIRELIDAILCLGGYKSYSHEASVAYLLSLGFSIAEASRVDQLRQQRNGIKYYGEDVSTKDALDALRLAEVITAKLRQKLETHKPSARK